MKFINQSKLIFQTFVMIPIFVLSIVLKDTINLNGNIEFREH